MWLSLLTACVFARAEYTTIHSTPRALGMGDAFTAVSRDGTALFYNPAGLSLAEGVKWTVLSGRAGAGGIDAFAKVKNLRGDSTNSQYAAAIKDLYGQSIWTGLALDSTFTIPNIAISAFDHADARVAVDNPVNPVVYTGVVNDFGYAAGLGAAVGERLHLGGALRYVKRTGARVPVGASDLADLKPEIIQSKLTGWGTGYGLDFGLDYVVPYDDFELTGAVAWRNVGQTRYHSDGGSVVPLDDNDVTLGLAARIERPGVLITPAVDVRYLNDGRLQFGRKVNFGLELSFGLVDIRGGFREGYYTIGAGLDLGMLKINAASYGVELGVYPGQLEDRRYVAEFILGLDLGNAFRARPGRLKLRR